VRRNQPKSWATLQKRLLESPPLNYALVSRWIGHLWLGMHENIAAAPTSEEIRGGSLSAFGKSGGLAGRYSPPRT
jgi:hypothetical protein